MTRPLAVLRPEPGNAATLARAGAAGFAAFALPLFEVAPLAWVSPDPTAYDALLLTSANAVRHAGATLAALRALPVLAVGANTAAAARAAGFSVALTGERDAADLVARAADLGFVRALHLAGRERMLQVGGIVAAVVPVYASTAVPILPEALARLRGSTALLHSARAAERLNALLDRPARAEIAVAAFSRAIAAAAGSGWAGGVVAATPDDQALFAAAACVRPAAC